MACAVGLEVLRIILEDKLSENAARMGKILKAKLDALAEKHPMIGQVRGIGLLLAMELVSDRETRRPFPPEMNVSQTLTNTAYDEGLIIYQRRCINGLAGDHVLVAPPLIVTEEQIDEIVRRLDRALARTAAAI
jgi:adenosylmethionine-8-amino-7-oxononanoate aminotransferase